MTEKEMLNTLEQIFNQIASNYSKENYQKVYEVIYDIYGFLNYDLGYSLQPDIWSMPNRGAFEF